MTVYIDKLEKLAEAAKGLKGYLDDHDELDCRQSNAPCHNCYFCDFNDALDALKPTLHQIVPDKDNKDVYHLDIDFGTIRTWVKFVAESKNGKHRVHWVQVEPVQLVAPLTERFKDLTAVFARWKDHNDVKLPIILENIELQDWYVYEPEASP